MSHLPNDVSRCRGAWCPIKETCERFRTHQTEQDQAIQGIGKDAGWRVYTDFVYSRASGCPGFMPVEASA
jgi:hypothetical protein